MNEYTFIMGNVNLEPGIYLSWIIQASSEEEAISKSRSAFAGDDSIEVDCPDCGTVWGVPASENGISGTVLRVNPDCIDADMILDGW